MKIHKDKTLSDQTFVLEEVVFQDCHLKDCDVFYSGGDFELLNSKFENCRMHFRGAAKNTQILMMTLGMVKAPIQLPPQTTSTSTQTH